MARNKITAHVIDWNNDVLEFIRLAQPDYAKVMVPQGHNTMKLARAKEFSPHTKWICRLYRDKQHLKDAHHSPSDYARDHAIRMEPFAEHYDIFEGYNEPPPHGPDDWKRVNEFDLGVAKIVHGWGKKYCAFNWSNGQPPKGAWQHCRDALMEADYIGLHSYAWPDLSQQPGLALRHRKIFKEEIPPLYRKPILLTEFGFTYLVANASGDDVGWRTWDIHPWAAKQYHCVEELAWMADRLAEDPYVLAACYFVTGRLLGDQWLSHDLTPSIYKKIAGYTPQPSVENSEGQEEPVEDWEKIWKNVPDRIKQWRPVIAKVVRGQDGKPPAQAIPSYGGVHVTPTRVIACIIEVESGGDPNAVSNPDNPDAGAQGLTQAWKPHYPERDLFDPEVNIRTGLEVLEKKLSIGQGNLREALYYYSGGNQWVSYDGFLQAHWKRFVESYKRFWGDDLEPSTDDHIQKAQECIARAREKAEGMEYLVKQFKDELDEAEGHLAGL